MKRPELSGEENEAKTNLQDAEVQNSKKNAKSKWRTAAIVLAVIVGGFAVLCGVAYFVVDGILDNLFGKMNYVSETDYQVPSSWDVDEDGIGASTNLEDLINQMQKEQEEKEKAEKEQAEKEEAEQGDVSPDLSE